MGLGALRPRTSRTHLRATQSDANQETSSNGNNPFDCIGYGSTGKKLSSIVKSYNPGGATSKERYDWISTHLANAVEEAIKIRGDN
jgi:hypothetical protein